MFPRTFLLAILLLVSLLMMPLLDAMPSLVHPALATDTLGGTTSANPTQLTNGPATDVNPYVMQDSNGKIWVLFCSDRTGGERWGIWSETSDDNGATWSTPKQVSPPLLQYTVRGISMMEDSARRLWIIWSAGSVAGGDNKLYYIISADGGVTWSNPHSPVGYVFASSSIVEAFGKVWIFYNWGGISVEISADGGQTWTAQIFMGSTERWSEHNPFAFLDSTGKLWLLWERNYFPGHPEFNRDIYYKTSDDGVNWSPEVQLTSSQAQEAFPSMVEISGRLCVFYMYVPDPSSDNMDIWYVSSTDKTTWSNPQRLITEPYNGGGHSLEPASGLIDGSVWVVWASSHAGNYDIWHTSNVYTSDTISITPVLAPELDGLITSGDFVVFWIYVNNAGLNPISNVRVTVDCTGLPIGIILGVGTYAASRTVNYGTIPAKHSGGETQQWAFQIWKTIDKPYYPDEEIPASKILDPVAIGGYDAAISVQYLEGSTPKTMTSHLHMQIDYPYFVVPSGYEQYVAGSTYYHPDDMTVKDAAAKAIGGTSGIAADTPSDAAVSVGEWVRNYFESSPLKPVDRRTDLTTLSHMQKGEWAGVCLQISEVTVSLLRAVGIPARIVVHKFDVPKAIDVTHQSVETFVDGRWLLVDPALGMHGDTHSYIEMEVGPTLTWEYGGLAWGKAHVRSVESWAVKVSDCPEYSGLNNPVNPLAVPGWETHWEHWEDVSDRYNEVKTQLTVTGHSPINILITDPDGTRVGYDPENDAVINEIPGAVYSGLGSEPQQITVDNAIPGYYRLVVHGTGDGSFTVNCRLSASNGTLIEEQKLTGEIVEDQSLTWLFKLGNHSQNYQQIQIHLTAGWNLISLPIVPENSNIQLILKSQIASGKLALVWGYIGVPRSWKSFIPGKSSTLATMTDGNGYWIYMRAADILYVNGTIIPPASVPPGYALVAGWNLVGFKPQPDIENKTVSQYLLSMTGCYDPVNVWIYENASGNWIRATDTSWIRPDQAMWVFVTAPSGTTLRP